MFQAKNENSLRLVRELQSAERAFLNFPHPLEILSDRNAYGSEGTISRDHDCRSYLKTLQRMRRNELKQRRRALREFQRQLWVPLLERGDVALGHFYSEPERYTSTSDSQPLGLEGQYLDIMKSADHLKSAGKFSHFFQFKQKRSGPPSQNWPSFSKTLTHTPQRGFLSAELRDQRSTLRREFLYRSIEDKFNRRLPLQEPKCLFVGNQLL
jgi:hypothetical protein